MVIVQIIGGTASQMSAFMKGWMLSEKLGTELILDVSDYINGYKFPYALDYFDLDCRKLKYMHATPYVISERIVPKEFLEEFNPYFIAEKSFSEICEEAEQHKGRNIYLVGETAIPVYEMYGIHEVFRIKENTYLNYFKTAIENIVSVAVHVRRTDFILLGVSNEYAYYEAAIQYVEERISNAIFFIFSDDLEDVKKTLGTRENYRYVKLPGGFITDVTEMICMSMCNHRIMTKQSGYSNWAAALSTNRDAFNIVFAEEESERYINLNRAMVAEYVHRKEEEQKRKAERMFCWDEDEEYIITAIDKERNADKAMKRICEISFDCGSISAEQLDKIYLYYESILLEKEKYMEAEQTLMKHLELRPDSMETSFNMGVAKRMLGKTFEAYLFASRACRKALNPAYTELFVKTFYNDEAFRYFRELCIMPKMHFIICPVSSAHFYKKHSFSLAIILKLLGHEVSVINGREVKLEYVKNITERQVVEFCIENAFEIDSSYQHHVKVYPYADIDEMDIYTGIISYLAESTSLPTVIIGRSFQSVKAADKYPFIYWDFSEEKDLDSQLVKQNIDWKKADYIMRNRASAVLTTKEELCAGNVSKIKFLESYIEQKPYWINKEKFFGVNYISDEKFLKFIYDMLTVARDCISPVHGSEG